MNVEEWKSQIRRGTLELCVMLLAEQKPCYGYELISRLEKWPMLAATESTIYPLLRRLLKEERLTAFWKETAEGLPPRKYYALTDQGREYLAAISEEWQNLLNAINDIQGGEENGSAAE